MTRIVEIDPFSAVGLGERHRVYGEMAGAGPIHRIVLPTSAQAWLITGHPAVRAELTDPRLVKFVASPTAALMQRERPDLARAMDTNVICCDGPTQPGVIGAVVPQHLRFRSRRIWWGWAMDRPTVEVGPGSMTLAGW